MALNKTKLLTDVPSNKDDFGTHERLAELIRAEILDANVGRSIAVVGDWGSGKSTIINILRSKLSRSEPPDAHVFIYDAWSHQGDQLRRAFLDDLGESLCDADLITEGQKLSASDRIWNRVEQTTTTTEPLLRRHAKWLLLMLALLPFGWKLFEVPASGRFWEEFLGARNLLGSIFLLAVPLSVALFWIIRRFGPERLKHFLFDGDYKRRDFSILSFFFEKVSGKAERKSIKSPADSIGEFKAVFLELLGCMQVRKPKLRLVVVIDNIDRIPSDQARDFWSTMQTFFGDGGGYKREVERKYWLIAPFSEQALAFTFQDKSHGAELDDPNAGDATARARIKARGYIDKTFALAFYIPPPILTDWRKHLLSLLCEAFFEHDQLDLVPVRDLFDYSTAISQSVITPRRLKLFVNALVALYRQRGEDVPLAVMAAYELHRHSIRGRNIEDDLLTDLVRRALDVTDWKVQFAAIHFGVSAESAIQLLLFDPILEALRQASMEGLKTQETKTGFFDVLPRAVFQHLSAPQSQGEAIAQIAGLLDSLEDNRNPSLDAVWRDLRARLQTATWGDFSASSTKGVLAIVTRANGHYPTLQRAVAVAMCAANQLPNGGDDRVTLEAAAAHWLEAIVALRNTADWDETTGIPGDAHFQMHVLSAIAEMKIPAETKALFAVTAESGAIMSVLASSVSSGHPLSVSQEFVSYVDKSLGEDWSPVGDAINNRLRGPIGDAVEFQQLLQLLILVAVYASQDNATKILRELSSQGILPHYLRSLRSSVSARAGVIVATILANPQYQRNGDFNNSGHGDGSYRAFMDDPRSDESLLKEVVNWITEIGVRGRVLAIAVKNEFVRPLAIASLGAIIGDESDTGKINLEPAAFLEAKDFLRDQRESLPLARLISRMRKKMELIETLRSLPFDKDQCFLYIAVLDSLTSVEQMRFAEFLMEGIGDLDKSLWEEALNIEDDKESLVVLCEKLRAIHPSFALKIAARDAVRGWTRAVGGGDAQPTESLKGNIQEIVAMLEIGLKDSLFRDIVDDMMGRDATYITNVLALLNSSVPLNVSGDRDRILRRLFNPIVADPTSVGLEWMNALLASAPDFLVELTTQHRSEFETRVRDGLAKEDQEEATLEALKNTARLIGIEDAA